MTAITKIFTSKEAKQLKATAKMLADNKEVKNWKCKEFCWDCFQCRLARVVEDLESLSEI